MQVSRTVWFIMAVVSVLTGTYLLLSGILAFVVGSDSGFAIQIMGAAILFYYGAYRAYQSWKKGRAIIEH